MIFFINFTFVNWYLAINFIQSEDLIFPVSGLNEKINIRLDKYQFGKTSFVTIWLQVDVANWKNEISKYFTSSDSKLVRFVTENKSYEDFNVKISSDYLDDLFLIHGTESLNFPVTNFMWFKSISNEPYAVGLYSAFKSNLAKVGANQLNIFERQLLETSKIFHQSKTIYAPFTSVVQSSGTGKSKLCVQTLLKHPGVYLVFRSKDSSGIPKPAPWINNFVNFVFTAEADELPHAFNSWKACDAIKYTPSRFLIALHSIILAYFKKCEELISTGVSHEECIKKIGNYFLENPTSTDSFLCPEFSLHDKRSVNDVVIEILSLVNIIPDEKYSYGLDLKLIKSIMTANPSSGSFIFPFLIFLDEADYLNELSGKGRVPGVHVVRRALHLLGVKAHLLVVAIGTNSDTLDFSLSVKDNASRYYDRRNHLPPLTLSCNWDIFSKDIYYGDLELTEAVLKSISMFKVLVSMGRPLWSSCNFDEVVSTCEAKLRNGHAMCLGSLMARLLVRASSSVNTHHVLSRSLVRSYMALVNYVSTDGKNLKISYSSEPILAMAARNLLSTHQSREDAFRAMKQFIKMQAIDKGRIVENIFEHFDLFAIDDAEAVTLVNSAIDKDPLPESFKALVDCKTYLLEAKEPNKVSVSSISNFDALYSNYRLVPVRQYLLKLLGREDFEVVLKFISAKNLDSFMNCTHYVNLERMKGNFRYLKFELDKSQDTGQNIIDRCLLKCGLLRQCGFILPTNYYAMDKVIPTLLNDKFINTSRPTYSFIGFKSKSSTVVTHECAVKMAANLHVVKCLLHHKTENGCPNGFVHKSPSSVFRDEELNEIFENNLVILETFENTGPKTFTPSLTLSRMTKASEIRKGHPKNLTNDEILELAKAECPLFSPIKNLNVDNVNITAYPNFSKIHLSSEQMPDLILTCNLKRNLSIQQMSWGSGSRSLTCIAIHDISNFKGLVNSSTIEVVKEIVNHTPSVFDSIDEFHLETVQKSTLDGTFCNYSYCNPLLSQMRGIVPMKDPIEKYFEKFNLENLTESIGRCVLGVIDMKIYNLKDDDVSMHDDNDDDDDVSIHDADFSEEERKRRSISEILKSGLDKLTPNKFKPKKNK